ncbi:MAG: GDP-L-fucose synthase [Pseudomonadota bacterium]
MRNQAPKYRKIYVAGHRGMVGAAITAAIEKAWTDCSVIGQERSQLDLRQRSEVGQYLRDEQPDLIIVCAATVGGIHANNSKPADFITDNLQIAVNLIDGAFRSDIKHLLYLGSSCIYPRNAHQPIHESELMQGFLEPTNEPYAIAKIAGIKLCESYNRQHGTDYRCVMPTNLYGPGDRFDELNGHVIPSLIRRFHEHKVTDQDRVKVWGTGNARREFLHVADLAQACLTVISKPKAEIDRLGQPQQSHINIGTGEDVSIRALAEKIAQTVGYEGHLAFDTSKPDGTPRKRLDIGKIASLGWQPTINLDDGLRETYEWFLRHVA